MYGIKCQTSKYVYSKGEEWTMLAYRSTANILEQDILPCLPANIAYLIKQIPVNQLQSLTEIRLRDSRPLMLLIDQGELFIDTMGRPLASGSNVYIVNRQDIENTLQIISQSSVYALEEELRNGYLTLRGGHRVGFTGQAVVEGGRLRTLKHIASFNIRIARELPGVADSVIPFLLKGNQVYNTLIISPPQCGKTTLLRDIARQLSNGVPQMKFRGMKIGVVDERSEIAGAYEGVPQNNIGIRTDVLDACPKAEGMVMLIRSMSPQVVVTDEIGRTEDVYAIREAVQAGVSLITTVHGADVNQIGRRPCMTELMREKVFERFILLGHSRGVGTIEAILDENHRNLLSLPVRREVRTCG
jgi:stage III sporulation protein AA